MMYNFVVIVKFIRKQQVSRIRDTAFIKDTEKREEHVEEGRVNIMIKITMITSLLIILLVQFMETDLIERFGLTARSEI